MTQSASTSNSCNSSRGTPRVQNDFIAHLRRHNRRGPPPITLDTLIVAIAAQLKLDPSDLRSTTRKPIHTLARALIAWHAFHNGIATLTEAARRLNRHPASLHSAIQRQRRKHPHLFGQSLTDLIHRA